MFSFFLGGYSLTAKEHKNKDDETKGAFKRVRQNLQEDDHYSGDRRDFRSEKQNEKRNFQKPRQQSHSRQSQNNIHESSQKNRSDYDQPKKESHKERTPTRSSRGRIYNNFRRAEQSKALDSKGDRNPSASDRRFSRENLRQKERRWREHASSYRRNFSTTRKRYHVFDDHYWNRFHSSYDNWYFSKQFSWNVAPSWSRVVVWLPWGWNIPIEYYYSEDGRVYYSRNADEPYFISVESNENYDIDAIALANSKPYVSTNQNDWISLGTFGIFSDKDTSQMPQEYLSIAISKDGAVSGAYVNVNDNKPMQIIGAVDKRSQRIAWKFVDQDWPVMEAGLYNLTKKESTMAVYLSWFKKQYRVIAQVEE